MGRAASVPPLTSNVEPHMDIQDTQAQNTYVEAVVSEAQAVVCSAHIPGFETEFARRFATWRAANAASLARGKDVMERAVAGGPDVQRFASMNAQVLDSLPPDDRQRRCDELLAQYLETNRS
ncbi:hypothetical protein ASE39_02635 [Acidovorax sp. Root267]|nr:hypothetical protein ASE39_02635 [Acidovorax sp. Root267]